MSYLGTAQKNVGEIAEAIKEVPELVAFTEYFQENPREVAHVFLQYVRILRRMSKLTSRELGMIADAQRRISENNEKTMREKGQTIVAKKMRRQFLGEKQPDELAVFNDYVFQMIENAGQNPTLINARAVLKQRMLGGSELFSQGRQPSDEDHDFDNVIWGHTQINREQKISYNTLIHFVVCHGIERYLSISMRDEGENPIQDEKDWFVTAMTRTILFMEAEESGSSGVLDTMTTPKQEGGLEWIPSGRLEVYQQVMAERQGQEL